jgi:hypothetical protein
MKRIDYSKYKLAKNKKERQNSFADLNRKLYPISWEIDSTKLSIEFKGFEGSYKKSEVTQKNDCFTTEKKPFTKQIPFIQIIKRLIIKFQSIMLSQKPVDNYRFIKKTV